MKPEVYKNNKTSIQGVTGERKGERLLDLSLPALVSGESASRKKFREATEIISISAEKALFRLKTPVQIGTSLRLSLKVPATTFLLHPLQIELSGQVSRIESNGQKNCLQLITLELDKKFQINPLVSSTGN